MKHSLFLTAGLFSLSVLKSQSDEYKRFIHMADSLYDAKDYRRSADHYSKAFKTLGWKGYINDRYNAACSWALAGVPDSAFYNLDVCAFKGGYLDYHHITTDKDLVSLYGDKRWQPIIDQVKVNKEKSEENLDKVLVRQLDSIYADDQNGRKELQDLEKKYGWNSKEIKEHWKTISYKDSINLIKVKRILDTRGWLGPDVIGYPGANTLFLVIQHADLETQKKYLPMMREAVKNKKAEPSSLSMLEDRIAMREGKKQIYGSQIGTHEDGSHFLFPLEDPDHVDDRRRSVGLGTISEYVSYWNIKWDVEQYKKDLPALEAKLKKNIK